MLFRSETKNKEQPRKRLLLVNREYGPELLGHVTLDVVVVRTPTLESGAVELLLGGGVGDGNQQACALLHGLAVEVDGAELGDEPVDVVARSDHAGTVQQSGANLGNALVGNRRHGDDGLAALGEGSAVDEVDLTADARPELGDRKSVV